MLADYTGIWVKFLAINHLTEQLLYPFYLAGPINFFLDSPMVMIIALCTDFTINTWIILLKLMECTIMTISSTSMKDNGRMA